MKVPETLHTEFGNYDLEFYDGFENPVLDEQKWLPYYLPQWSSREAGKAQYAIADGILTLSIGEEQKPWCPEFNDQIRVSSLQTGVFSGPVGSSIGQHHFSPRCTVREYQEAQRLYLPRYGFVSLRARAALSADHLAALWMIGFEDEPERSAEICIFEVKGSNVGTDSFKLGFGVHPFGDPQIRDQFYEDEIVGNVEAFNTYSVEWKHDFLVFYVNGQKTRVIKQSPTYEMQLMLNIYDLKGNSSEDARFEVDYVCGYKERV